MNTLLLEDGTPKRQHRKRLNDLMSKTYGLVRITSACVTDHELFSNIGGRETRLLISLLPVDIASGAMSLETLKRMLDSGVKIRVLPDRPRLHAKTYIFGTLVAVITSANLTKSALDSNLEVGIELHGRDLKKLTRWFDQLWQNAAPLSVEHLIVLQGKVDLLRREYIKFEKLSQSALIFEEQQQTVYTSTDIWLKLSQKSRLRRRQLPSV